MRSADDYVYVNQDGTVRELSPKEKAYLEEEFAPFDGGRPYIKSIYQSRNGYDSLSGFLARKSLPWGTNIVPVNPDYDRLAEEMRKAEDYHDDNRAVGDIVEETEVQGRRAVSITPNPHISKGERFAQLKRLWLEREVRREKLAKMPEQT